MNKDDQCWFKHSAYLRQEAKMMDMFNKYEAVGYGCYMMLLERLRLQEDFSLRLSEGVLSELALEMRQDKQWLKAFIEDCIMFELFLKENDRLYSPDLNSLLEELLERREEMKERGRKGGKTTQANRRNKVRLLSDTQATASGIESNSFDISSREENRIEENLDKPLWKTLYDQNKGVIGNG